VPLRGGGAIFGLAKCDPPGKNLLKNSAMATGIEVLNQGHIEDRQ